MSKHKLNWRFLKATHALQYAVARDDLEHDWAMPEIDARYSGDRRYQELVAIERAFADANLNLTFGLPWNYVPPRFASQSGCLKPKPPKASRRIDSSAYTVMIM